MGNKVTRASFGRKDDNPYRRCPVCGTVESFRMHATPHGHPSGQRVYWCRMNGCRFVVGWDHELGEVTGFIDVADERYPEGKTA